ncbi:hypothetical protein OG402_29910 [Streptomyces anulatus]|uniref:hypothetical protein n=1 Tax=Streptomyces anulatus TaxID=1892 RepID=UPI00225BF314|nr:hypothetical protein [Streptomyces anulatus]MCX4604684.1 hypothetical protein [Streptomyces anulatus]
MFVWSQGWRGATRTPPRHPATRPMWYDAASTDGGLAGISCTVPDVAQEAAFREEFAGASWQERGPDAARGTIPSPRSRGECAFVIARGEDAPGHATNDVGFPSMSVFSTSIAADRDRAVAAGATPLAEPIVTYVGGRRPVTGHGPDP